MPRSETSADYPTSGGVPEFVGVATRSREQPAVVTMPYRPCARVIFASPKELKRFLVEQC
jgi:hypothetical protein